MRARHVAREVGDVVVCRMRHDLLGRPHLDEPAVLHDRDPVAELQRLGEVVGDEDHRLLHLVLEADHLVLHVAADQRVQRAEGFIEEHDLRVGRQRAGQADALLHPARELVGVGIPPPAETHDVEDLIRLRFPGCLLHALDLQAEPDVLDDPAVRQQAEVLEHHADLRAAHLAEPLVVEHQDVLPVEEHAPGGRVVQAVQHPHERRLARAGQAHDHEDLTRGDVERDVADGDDASGLQLELGPGEVGVGGADDAVGLRAVDLPDVAARNRGLRRVAQRTPSPRRCRPAGCSASHGTGAR